MSNPSFENIDRWLFEYVEGNLNPEQVARLEQFISAHPELQQELNNWKSAKSEKEPVIFDTTAYIKANPWIGYSKYAALALLFTGISYFIFDYFSPKNAQYVLTHIDASIIETDENEIFAEKPGVIASENSNSSVSITESFTLNKNETSQNTADNLSTLHKTSTDLNHIKRDLKIVNQDMNKYTANELAQVVKSINKENNSIEQQTTKFSGDELAVNELNEHHKSSNKSSSLTFKNKMNDAKRKFKRMLDQPVALKNSKDIHFHAPMMTGYQANFGMTGAMVQGRLQSTSRNQWVGQENQQLQNIISYDGYVQALKGGLGFDVIYSNYQKGGIEDFMASLTYSPKISINKNISIEPAFRFKMGTTSLNQNSSVIGQKVEKNRNQIINMFPDDETPIGQTLWQKDIGAGLLINTKWFFAGFNVDNMRRHYNNFHSSNISQEHRAFVNYTAVAGTEYRPIGKNIKYNIYALYQNFGPLNEIWTGGNVQWKFIETGIGINQKMDLGASFGLKMKNISAHYNIDYINSSLINDQILSHQISLRLLLKANRSVQKLISN